MLQNYNNSKRATAGHVTPKTQLLEKIQPILWRNLRGFEYKVH